MGLDMFLTGEKFYWTDWRTPEVNLREDGFRLRSKVLELGYWRKHPDLHGFIVQTFAAGVDECQDIQLTVDDLKRIIQVVKDKLLPYTKGFFFGGSDGSEDAETIDILEKAIAWVESEPDGKRVTHSVVYRASW